MSTASLGTRSRIFQLVAGTSVAVALGAAVPQAGVPLVISAAGLLLLLVTGRYIGGGVWSVVVVSFAMTAAFSDSNIVDPIASGSGLVGFHPLKVAPYLLLLGSTAVLLLGLRGRRSKATRAEVALGIYFVAGAIGAATGPQPVSSLLRLGQGLVPFLSVLAAMRLAKDRRHLLLTAVVAAVWWHVGSALFLYSRGEGFLPLGPNDERLAGFIHPDSLAIASAFLVSIGLVRFLSAQDGRRTLIGIAMMGAGLLTLILARGRTGFVALLAMGLVAVLSRPRARIRDFLGWIPRRGLIIAVSSLFVIVSATSIFLWFERGTPEDLTSFTGRTRLWTHSFDLIKERPLFGWGPGILRVGGVAEATISGNVGFGGHAHNALLEALLGAGLIGGVAWAVAVGSAARTLLSGAMHSERESDARVLMVGLLVAGITDGGLAGYGLMWLAFCALLPITVTLTLGRLNESS